MSEADKEMSLHEKLMGIQQRLKVPKDRDNDFADFKYRSIEDIEDKIKPLLKEYGLVLTFDDEMVGVGNRVYVKATATLIDSEGNQVSASAYAREAEKPKAKTDDAQLTGACSSYARKYAASGLLLIDNTADADSRVEGKVNTGKLSELNQAKSNVFKAFKDKGIEESEVMLEIIEKATGKNTIDNYDDALLVIAEINKD